MRRIVSLWLPRFATDRLHRVRATATCAGPAEAAGARLPPPVALATAAPGRHGLGIGAVDRAAQAGGVRPGLSVADARALLPTLTVVPADARADARALAALADWCGRYTPSTAVDGFAGHPGAFGGGAGLWLDASGCAHLFGGEEALLADLTRRLAALGLAARAAIAGTAGAAWAVARFGAEERTVVPPGGEEAVLSPLPVRALRPQPEVAATLHRIGLRRIADLAPLPRAPLAARFGDDLLRRLDQALGRIDEPLSPRRPQPAFRARLAFAEPIGRIDDVAAALEHLLVEICRALAAADRGARRLELALYRVDGTLARTAVGTSRPNREPGHLRRLFREKLDGLDPGFGIEVATLEALVVDPLAPEQRPITLGGGDASGTESLAQLVDRLGNRLGTTAVVRLAPYPSHVPERACRAIPALAGRPSPAAPSRSQPAEDHRSRQPRPPLLLASPEPIEVVAPVPDGPPALFRRGGRPHRITTAIGPERIGAEWWLIVGGHAADAQQSALRDYWRIEDACGQRFWIFRDGLFRPDRPARWWLHGLFG